MAGVDKTKFQLKFEIQWVEWRVKSTVVRGRKPFWIVQQVGCEEEKDKLGEWDTNVAKACDSNYIKI